MSFQTIEKFRVELLNDMPNLFGKNKLTRICTFYTSLLSTNDSNLIEAYSPDFVTEFIVELKQYTPFYNPPQSAKSLLSLLKELKIIATLKDYESEFEKIIELINSKLGLLFNKLYGQDDSSKSRSLKFPLIETTKNHNSSEYYGSLESVNVKIHKTKNSNRFVFVPSGKKVEELLLNQTQISFQTALTYFSNYKSINNNFQEVLIYFDNLTAEYEGNSLGLALTIEFVEQLSLLYNLPYLINVKNNIAATGGVDSSGKILSVGHQIIEKKIETVFFSNIDMFVIPKEDELNAATELTRRKDQYPNRKLELVPISNINEFLNKRDLVEIKKQLHVVRAARTIKKNWVTSILLLILTLILMFIYIKDFDHNPYMYEQTANEILIKNKRGYNLWGIKYPINIELFHEVTSIESNLRILDVNDDGINEVLFQFSRNTSYADTSISTGLALINSKGEVIWRRSFRKLLTSKREFLIPPYSLDLFDTLRINNELCILCGSNNQNSYVSAAYILNLRKNKIVSDTLWNPGHINDIRIVDLNKDGNSELVVLANNNSYKKNALFHLHLDDLKGQVPTTDEYRLNNINNANTLHYFLFPNSDYNQFLNFGYNCVRKRALLFDFESKTIRFNVWEGGLNRGTVIYNWVYSINDFNLAIGNDFQLVRDSLVARGELNEPYTDTKEYRELLRKQILAWNGKKFMPLDEWKNEKAAK